MLPPTAGFPSLGLVKTPLRGWAVPYGGAVPCIVGYSWSLPQMPAASPLCCDYQKRHIASVPWGWRHNPESPDRP